MVLSKNVLWCVVLIAKKLISAYNSLIIGDIDLGSHRKSLARNLLVWSDLTFGPLLQGQMRTAKLKSAYNSFIIGPRGLEW